MSFLRCLDEKQISSLYNNSYLYNLLERDIISGNVFPAIRKNQLYFYYKGGCLYKFSNGKFTRDKAYEKYNFATTGLSAYEAAKKQNENKFTNSKGDNKERQLLDNLYSYTFGNKIYNTVVLDIEVNLNGTVSCGKKCDLVLFNKKSRVLMFVEGKVFADRRVNVKCGLVPEVIEQVNTYTAAIAEQEQIIIEQYGNHIDIINRLFGTDYSKPISLIKPAKLLVYETPSKPTENNLYSIDYINSAIKANNVAWFKQSEKPSLDEIWEILCK
ncbi:MAG: hypothetical protein K2K38_00630 [Clostridia bacterium]|nr:hypothetical protein [Clostridia bacterium]